MEAHSVSAPTILLKILIKDTRLLLDLNNQLIHHLVQVTWIDDVEIRQLCKQLHTSFNHCHNRVTTSYVYKYIIHSINISPFCNINHLRVTAKLKEFKLK